MVRLRQTNPYFLKHGFAWLHIRLRMLGPLPPSRSSASARFSFQQNKNASLRSLIIAGSAKFDFERSYTFVQFPLQDTVGCPRLTNRRLEDRLPCLDSRSAVRHFILYDNVQFKLILNGFLMYRLQLPINL